MKEERTSPNICNPVSGNLNLRCLLVVNYLYPYIKQNFYWTSKLTNFRQQHPSETDSFSASRLCTTGPAHLFLLHITTLLTCDEVYHEAPECSVFFSLLSREWVETKLKYSTQFLVSYTCHS